MLRYSGAAATDEVYTVRRDDVIRICAREMLRLMSGAPLILLMIFCRRYDAIQLLNGAPLRAATGERRV